MAETMLAPEALVTHRKVKLLGLRRLALWGR